MGDSCPFYKTVRLCVNESKRAKTGIGDAPRLRTPKSAVTPKKIDIVHNIVLADRREKVHEFAKALGILMDQVHFIFQYELHMKNMYTLLRTNRE